MSEIQGEQQRIEVRNLVNEDYSDLIVTMTQVYGDREDNWKKGQIEKLLKIFPEGQIAVLVDGKVVGVVLSIIVNYERFGDNHNYQQITGNEKFTTHRQNGDVLYGIEVFIHPDYRGMRLGRRLYDARKELCEQLNLRAIIAGGRIPNYKQYAEELTPFKYIQKVKSQEIHDPVLDFQLSNDFHVKRVLKNYMPGDEESKEYATLLEWINLYYEPEKKYINTEKSEIRLGLVQWQMRHFSNLEALFDQIEFFVDTVASYKSDFVLFPELFNAPLMAKYNHLSESEAIRKLATYTDKLREKFVELAMKYNINIITGSMPVLDEEKLYNKGYLCRRNGSFETYEKLHITPAEKTAWGMQGGNDFAVFDTDCGKIGVTICYDIEFPELSRLLSMQGAQIIFVPFMTDTQNGYTRVRNCAQARAIENECYVAIAGNVGNLPKVNNMDIQFAQSAVFTPSDFSFPTNGIKAEATPNTEMTLIADVNIDLLKELHNKGSVTNIKDRRTDLYTLFGTNKKTKEK